MIGFRSHELKVCFGSQQILHLQFSASEHVYSHVVFPRTWETERSLHCASDLTYIGGRHQNLHRKCSHETKRSLAHGYLQYHPASQTRYPCSPQARAVEKSEYSSNSSHFHEDSPCLALIQILFLLSPLFTIRWKSYWDCVHGLKTLTSLCKGDVLCHPWKPHLTEEQPWMPAPQRAPLQLPDWPEFSMVDSSAPQAIPYCASTVGSRIRAGLCSRIIYRYPSAALSAGLKFRTTDSSTQFPDLDWGSAQGTAPPGCRL